ncbi:MAG TPA: hypothetical protein ENI23_17225 [bacterium]|nr:hypothetical protein [bacterium]
MKIIRDKEKTVAEKRVLEEAKRKAHMNWKMAEALVQGRVKSEVLKHAEDVYFGDYNIYVNKGDS